MEKSELKNGMIARMESGSMAIILESPHGEKGIFSFDGMCYTGIFNFKGINEWDEDHNIVDLYDIPFFENWGTYSLALQGNTSGITPVWSSTFTKGKEMTIAEIEKELGYQIKIVNKKGE